MKESTLVAITCAVPDESQEGNGIDVFWRTSTVRPEGVVKQPGKEPRAERVARPGGVDFRSG